MATARIAEQSRRTGETDITVCLDLDGSGKSKIETGVPFFDHMLTLLAKHGLLDLEVKAVGDIEVDYHHTVEDTGIVLGQCFKQALGDKVGIRRYGWCLLPMDECLARVALDLSGRPFLHFEAPGKPEPVREFSFQLVEEFFRAFSNTLGCNLHATILTGRDSHHMAEALFKGLAKSLETACSLHPRVTGVPSTKDVL
ncbi:MAG: imidazoleglycerol-phosphate dehydratase HisB [Verrucomicrobiota bacterium]